MEPHLQLLEHALSIAPNDALIMYGLQAAQGLGFPTPVSVAGQDLGGFANKIRSSLLSDGFTRLRPSYRALFTHFLIAGNHFTISPELLLLAAVKTAIPEALTSVAYAEINHARDLERKGAANDQPDTDPA